MQKLIETLKGFGIEVPEDKQADVKKAISEHYKNVGEVKKATQKLEAERDNWKDRAETAETALAKLDGVDPAQVKQQLEDAQQQIKAVQKAADKRIEERDFNDALKIELDGVKFTSTAARKAVEAEIRAAGLKLKDGKILGLSDLIDQIKKEDASAFVNENQQQLDAGKAQFTQPGNNTSSNGTLTASDIMAIKDAKERQAQIAKNIHLFKKG